MSGDDEQLKESPRLPVGHKGIFWAAQNRILFCYGLLLALIFIAVIPAFRSILMLRVNERVRGDMTEKASTFNALVEGKLDGSLEGSHWSERRDERLKPPTSIKDLEAFFDAYLSRQVPEDDVYLITFTDGDFYRSSPRARPEILKQGSSLMNQWAALTIPQQGEKPVDDPELEKLIYIAQPIQANGQTIGVFIMAHTTAGEQREVLEAVDVVIQVTGGVLVLALLLGWFASGQILAPLQSLSSTARSIGESDLTQRISIQGAGEIADLANTFNDMMDRLQSAFTTQRNFINDAGHELRTPLTIIRGHIELMGNDPIEQQETMNIVMDELDRMNRFVDDLILLAKSERPDFLQLEPVSLESLTQELFTKACALADRNWVLDNVGQGEIIVDRQRITQAVMNLAQNATQHTQTTQTISIGSAISSKTVRFWVRDTGEGISLVDQQRIFERFARSAKSRRRSEGAGLGLAIVRAIVEAHHGQIKLRSQLGRGSTFTMIIPLEDAISSSQGTLRNR
ncbi:sensor histidine kinase [Phormidesmis sp. 146-33]